MKKENATILDIENQRKLYILLIIVVITGGCSTIFLRLESASYSEVLGAPVKHPWIQTLFMFMGECACSVVWFRKRRNCNKANYSSIDTNGKPKPSPFLFLIGCACDLVGGTLLNFSLVLMPTSVFQMLRGGIVIITLGFRWLFLKRKPKIFESLGVFLAFLGLFLVGLSSQINSSENPEILGIILLIVSLLFSGFQFVFHEMIMSKYKCEPIQIISWEGIWGMLITLILLPIIEFIPCRFKGAEKVCSINPNGDLYLENSVLAFRQMFNVLPIFIYFVMQSITVALFNYFGITIVNQASSSTRSMICSARTLLVWLFFLIVPINGKTEVFLDLQLAGFVFVIIGQLIYNKLVSIELLAFSNKNQDGFQLE